MKQQVFKTYVLLSVIFIMGFNSIAYSFDGAEKQSTKLSTAQQQITARKLDVNAEVLSKYLARHNSPLQYHAQDFIDAANEYDLDWKLVVAIAGVESTFGKFTPGGYNGWGWGVYGNQAIYFTSWREGIFTVSKSLKEDYVSRGLTNPYSMNKRYAASPYWGGKVSFFMNDIDKFAKNYNPVRIIADVNPLIRIAAISGQLTAN